MFQCACQAVVQCTKGTVIFQSDRVSPNAYAATERAFHQLLRRISSVDLVISKGKTIVTIMVSTTVIDHAVASAESGDQERRDMHEDRQTAKDDGVLLATVVAQLQPRVHVQMSEEVTNGIRTV
jgi:hypothetical protein